MSCNSAWFAVLAGVLALNADAADDASKPVLTVGPVQKLDEIRVTPKIDPEDLKAREKTPLQKMRDFLDQRGKSMGTVVRESPTGDGRRIAQVNMGEQIFCIDDKRGVIDFAADTTTIKRGGVVTRPVGSVCR